MQSMVGHAPIVDVLAAAGVQAARKHAGGAPVSSVSSASSSLVMQSAGIGTTAQLNISLPLGREAKVLSVVEVCGMRGMCKGCTVHAQHRSGDYGVGRVEYGHDGEPAIHALR
jgi:hypothetical protein